MRMFALVGVLIRGPADPAVL